MAPSLKTKENAALLHECFVDLDSVLLRLGRAKLDVKEILWKPLHVTFSSKTSSNPTSMKKYNECSTQRHLMGT